MVYDIMLHSIEVEKHCIAIKTIFITFFSYLWKKVHTNASIYSIPENSLHMEYYAIIHADYSSCGVDKTQERLL